MNANDLRISVVSGSAVAMSRYNWGNRLVDCWTALIAIAAKGGDPSSKVNTCGAGLRPVVDHSLAVG